EEPDDARENAQAERPLPAPAGPLGLQLPTPPGLWCALDEIAQEAGDLVESAPQTWWRRELEAERARRRRKWSFRLCILACVVGLFLVVRTVRSLVWDQGAVPHGAVDTLISYGSFFWAIPALPAFLALLGLVSYRGLPSTSRGAPAADPYPIACPNEVCFRIVSRGRNADALRGTVESVRECLRALPLYPYRIEVVTDVPVELDVRHDVRAMVVPDDYCTPNRSQFKARALQYAIDVSDLPDDAWIMHLDEESHLSPSVVVGIRDAVNEEERSGRHRIGQGLILYHRNLDSHRFLTLADMIRTGEDLGRFHFQHRLGFTLFGLHGSFILVRNSVERAVGFDVGPEGSITEDAFWALRQMAAGRRCRWVEGCIVEQAPATVKDFVKQRRRWFSGLVRVILYAEAKVWIRIPLAISTTLWAVSWLGLVYTYVNLVTGFRTGTVVSTLGDFAFSLYLVSYLVGLYANLRDRPKLPLARQAGLYALQVVLLPVFTLMEAAGVIYALVRPERGFHVIRK
ncbi:MAG TPA: glycosyltransferase family 2 protein, partial [Acidimicrobiales bacterium]|nr:glycosyltransferase family 2 protein [Acidimicrobiales bacterium]